MMDLLEKLEFSISGDSFFFYIPSDLQRYLMKREDYEKNRDLITFIIQDTYPILINDSIKDEDDVYHYVTIVSVCEDKIIEETIQFNCYHSFEKSHLFLKILFYFQNCNKILDLLKEYGLKK